MEVRYSKKAEKDLAFWSKSGNKIIIKKITELIKDIQQIHLKELGNQKL